MGLISPTLPDLDVDDWRALPRAERQRTLAQHWAVHGFGTPKGIYLLYALKIVLYVLGAAAFVTATPGIAGIEQWRDWWTEPVVFQKVIIWTLLFEVLGLGCGFGPLTLRFLPPIGAFLYWLRPGTIRLPAWPDRVPGTAGSTRTLLDVVLYVAVVASAVWILIAPADRYADGGAPDVLAGAELTSMIEPTRFVPLLVLLPLLGLRDKTIFLAARAEHYWVTAFALLLPFVDMIIASQLVMVALWWGAATSKLNHHFPFVVATMISNAPLYPKVVKKRLWKHHEHDVRPSRLAEAMAHGGTVVEFTLPLALLVSTNSTVSWAVAIAMVLFHLHILSAIPMGVPLEWNVVMMFGAVWLFAEHGQVRFADTEYPWLILIGLVVVVSVVIYGNLRPRQVSFLPSMRYYAGNWPTSAWLFGRHADGTSAEETYAAQVPKAAQLPQRQLAKLYPPDVVDLLMGKVGAFRSLHTHGRALLGLYAHAAGDHEERFVIDGEMVAGSAIGWNFGDGHLHDEQLLSAIQERCRFAPCELRVIMLESQPLMKPVQRYRIVDAATGVIEEGEVDVADMVAHQPWDGDLGFRVTKRVE